MGRKQGWGRTAVRSEEAGGTGSEGWGRRHHRRQGGPGEADRRGLQATPRRRLMARVGGDVAVMGGAVVAMLEVVQVPGAGTLTRVVMDRGLVWPGPAGMPGPVRMPGPVVVTSIFLMTGPVVMSAVVVMPGLVVMLAVVPSHVHLHPQGRQCRREDGGGEDGDEPAAQARRHLARVIHERP